MSLTWTVCRQPSPRRDGQRRWDQAYQLLVRCTEPGDLPWPAPIAEEVPIACGGLCAVSTTRQAQAQTIEQQLDRPQAVVAEHGRTRDEQHVYRDDGYSGTSLGRAWTGCGTMRHWPSSTWCWSPHPTGWPATTSTRCCSSTSWTSTAARWSFSQQSRRRAAGSG